MFEFKPSYRVVDACRRISCAQLRIVGEVISRCPEPAGIKVRITARDKKGEIVNVAEGWPNSVRNFPAMQATPITLTGLLNYERSMEKFDSAIIDVRRW